jgi:hypothetical protein
MSVKTESGLTNMHIFTVSHHKKVANITAHHLNELGSPSWMNAKLFKALAMMYPTK